MKKTAFTFLICSSLIYPAIAQKNIKENKKTGGEYLSHQFKNGEQFGTIFSRTISVTGKDFQPSVFRISGTGNYKVSHVENNQPDFDAIFLYDGRAEDRCSVGIRDGGGTSIYNGKSSINTDGSGLVYNAFIWGKAPAAFKAGDHWETTITQPWELGGPGRQQIEVIEADPKTHLVRLKRQGDGEGAFADDQQEMYIVMNGKPVRVKITPGKNHWVGYTTFKNGIVISDELMTTRDLNLTNDTLKVSASQRQYILLNQMAG